MENVTPYSFGVATNWEKIGLNYARLAHISYELNHGNVTSRCEQGYNSTHGLCNVYVMRPKTMFKVRFMVCYWYTETCTDFSKPQTVWTKPASKQSIYYKNATFDTTKDLDIWV